MGRSPNRSRQARLLFEALLKSPRTWRHGYALSQETALQSGTLYPLLIRLEEQGLLDAKWEEAERPGRPPRHAYRLTAKGSTYAQALLADAPPLWAPRLKGSAP